MEFENAVGRSRSRSSLATLAGDTATEILVKSGAFIVIEREQLALVLKEQGLGMTGAINSQTAAKAGQLLGLQALITGKVLEYDEGSKSSSGWASNSTERKYTARVSLKMIDTSTGEVWAAESAVGVAREISVSSMRTYDENLGKRALYRAARKAVGGLVTAANGKRWHTSVAKVSDGKLYIVAGAGSGIKVGAQLQIRALGEEITDPSTMQVIGRGRGRNARRCCRGQTLK